MQIEEEKKADIAVLILDKGDKDCIKRQQKYYTMIKGSIQ